MGMSDPFSTTYQGSFNAGQSLGNGIQSAAGSVADVMKQKNAKVQQDAQNKKMMDLFGIGQQTGLIDKQDPTNDQLAQGLQDYGKQSGVNVKVIHGDNPDQAKSNMLGIYKALGIPVPKGTIKVNADTNMKSGMKATLEFDEKGNLRPKFTTVDPETEALREQSMEMRKEMTDSYKERTDAYKENINTHIETEIATKVNPTTASPRSGLGLLGNTTIRAKRAIDILNDPNVKTSSQVMAASENDIAGIIQGGAPTQTGMNEQDYNTVLTNFAKLKQFATAHPEDATPPEIKSQLLNSLKSLNNTGKQFIKNNIKTQSVVYRPWIKENKQQWDDMISSINDEYGVDSSNDASTITKMTRTNSQPSKYTLVQ